MVTLDGLKDDAIRKIAVHSDAADSIAISALCARAGLDVTLIEPDLTAHERLRHHLNALGGRGANIVDMDVGSRDLDIVSDVYSFDIPGSAFPVLAAQPQDPNMSPFPSVVFAAPLHLRNLVEILPGRADAKTLARLSHFISSLQKTPVRVGQSVVTALFDAALDALDDTLLRGALHTEIDEALKAEGASLGLCEAQDLIGLERAYARRRRTGAPRLLAQDRMVEEGRLGKHASVGWYRYPGGGGAVEDPLIEDLIAEEAHFARIPRTVLSGDEALAQVLAAMHLTCRNLVKTGIRPQIFELAWTEGLGLPKSLFAPLKTP